MIRSSDLADRDGIERAIAGALRATIHDHGPITVEHIGSAVKRIVGNLANASGNAQARPKRGGARSRGAARASGEPLPGDRLHDLSSSAQS